MDNIEGLVKKAKNIPVLPQVSSKLLAVFNDPGAEAKERVMESLQAEVSEAKEFYGIATTH